MKCNMCRRGAHKACVTAVLGGPCTCTHEATPPPENKQGNGEEDASILHSPDEEESDRRQVDRRSAGHGRGKRDAALKDQQSTGRKRAARLYPLISGAPCEWRGLAECGGGRFPILGCVAGLQNDRHHGPDKATSNNEPGNVHRICTGCHHEWHAVNNESYDWKNTIFQSHNPRPMTDQELWIAAERDVARKERKVKRIRD